MPTWNVDIEDRRIGTGATIPYLESEFPPNFPLMRWNQQLTRYIELWNAFSGWWLTESTGESDERGNPILRYPLQINYLRKACLVHGQALFGEVSDSPEPLAPIRITPRSNVRKPEIEDEARMKSEELENFINQVWMDNNGRALQQDAGTIQQPLGGIVFRASWVPDNLELEYGIRLEYILPDFFLPIWDTGRPDELYEVWIVYRLPGREAALKYGVELTDNATNPLYVEHWTRTEVNITIGNVPIRYKVNGIEINYDHAPNPFGFVPFVYIPRMRAGSYYGPSLLEDVIELAKEMNSRAADNSDVIEETSHREVYLRNVTISPYTQDIGSSRPAINIGQTPPGGETPDVFAINPPSLSDPMVKYLESLRQEFGRQVFVPGVAEGEDEGSQRSALTLAFRMWPLTRTISACRTYWTVGLIRLAKFITKIAILKRVGGITEDHLKNIDWSVRWSPIIPRDREADLNEAAIGIQTNMITPRDGNRKLGLTDDPVKTETNVKEWMTFVNDLAATQTQNAGNTNPKVKTNEQTTQTTMDKANQV